MANFTKKSKTAAKAPPSLIKSLASIELGKPKKIKFKKRDLIFILRNVSILVRNGLSLPRALDVLSKEDSLRKYGPVLDDVKQRVENGEAFSDALARYPDAFSEIMVVQVRIGEKSGTIPETLARIMRQLEHLDSLKATIIKKMSYPTLLIVSGSAAVTFMLLYVVPTFEKIYEETKAQLPSITKFMIAAGDFGLNYGWMIALTLVGLVVATVITRSKPQGLLWMDTWILKVPLLGRFFKNIAILQFMQILSVLMDAGFTVVEALKASTNGVGNRAVRRRIEQMHEALLRGERFSSELERHGDLFPPVVTQLVVVGEQTGTLPETTVDIRAHLKREVETYTNIMVGTIEPVATAGMAITIGTILLAIYLPMFDMIGSASGNQ